jgi:hypothetical protein
MTLYSCECSAALAVREQTKINATSMDEYAFYQTSRADYCSDRPSLPLGELCLILEHVSEMNGEVSNKPSTVPGASRRLLLHRPCHTHVTGTFCKPGMLPTAPKALVL